jgi:hypothetical protein
MNLIESNFNEIKRLLKIIIDNNNIKFNDLTLLEPKEVMRIFSISKNTLVKWRESGVLPYVRIASKIYYKHTDIKKRIEESTFIDNPQNTASK